MKALQLGLILVALGAIVFELDAIRRATVAGNKTQTSYFYQSVRGDDDTLRILFPGKEVDREAREGWEYCDSYIIQGRSGPEVHAVMKKQRADP